MKYVSFFCLLVACSAPSIEVRLDLRDGPSPSPVTQLSVETTRENGEVLLATLTVEQQFFPKTFSFVIPGGEKGEAVSLSIRGVDETGGESYFAEAKGRLGGETQAFIEFCGDGNLFRTEECDEGNLNSNTRSDACRNTCVFSFCGDAVKDLADVCDDGNGIEGDGCDTNCTVSACGNGILAPGELCFSFNESLLGLQQPHALVEIDLDQDGDLDLVTSHPEADTLRIFRNEGDATFGFGENLSAVGVTKISKGDIDQDGDTDLVALTNDGFSASTQIFLNEAGDLVPFGTLGTAYELKDVLLEDMNQDGFLDIILVDGTSSNLRVQWGQGYGAFSAAEFVPTGGSSPRSVDARDLTGDGVLDLVVANEGDNSVSFIQGVEGENSFTLLHQLQTLSKPVKVVIDEFDGELGLDVAVAQESGHVRVFKNNNGIFEVISDFPVGEAPSSLVSVDIDLDGDRDLVTTNLAENTVSVLTNNGVAQFGEPKDEEGSIIRFDTRVSPVDLVEGDFNQDGTPDLAVVGQNIGLLLSNP